MSNRKKSRKTTHKAIRPKSSALSKTIAASAITGCTAFGFGVLANMDAATANAKPWWSPKPSPTVTKGCRG